MAIFKCKMCGGDLEIADGITVAECEYCGTKQTVPNAMDENLQNLFNRANTLRIKSEFDKAEKLYEKIIESDASQADAYWGLILCRYGIEYVDDPATFKKIPTCHRASYESIIADEDYKSALRHADSNQRGVYELQAKEIDKIQKEILALARKEETFDVFICYKETDTDGRRTQDSVIANDVYYQLTNEGFKVFYAAITLEDKLGSAYEPVIFAALNSAKVMLAIGTRPEHFNAVWVKNEWSRFLKIIKNDRSKMLIPCYRDMDAYELPEEFAHLQAQDMSKIGFINDIVRGIKKVIKKDEPKQAPAARETVSTAAANSTPLLKRAFLFLEDEEWDSADEYCEKVLDIDPENAYAYLGKLMIELRVSKPEDLKNEAEPFNEENYYKKALRFADDKFHDELTGYIDHINTRNENARKDVIYNRAKDAMDAARTDTEYENAAELFVPIREHRDSALLEQQCYASAKDYVLAQGKTRMAGGTIADYQEAIRIFGTIPSWKDADKLIETCHRSIQDITDAAEAKRKDDILAQAQAKMDSNTIADYEAAIEIFAAVSGWRNADEQINKCHRKIEELKIQAETKRKDDIYANGVALMTRNTVADYRSALETFASVSDWKDADWQISVCRNKIEELELAAEVNRKDRILNDAKARMSRDTVADYQEAIRIFGTIPGWRDADEQIFWCNQKIEGLKAKAESERLERERQAELNRIKTAARLKRAKKIALITTPIVCVVLVICIVLNMVIIPGIRNKAEDYNAAIALMDAGEYTEAIAAFQALGRYKDSKAKAADCQNAINDIEYAAAVALMDAGKYEEAITAFEALNGYKDSTAKITECQAAANAAETLEKDRKYNAAISLMDAGKYEEAVAAFEALNGYKDSTAKITECQAAVNAAENLEKDRKYNAAIALMDAGKYKEALTALKVFVAKYGGYKDAKAKITDCTYEIEKEAKEAEKQSKYNDAVALMNAGKYDQAIEAFEVLGGYKDSAAKISECNTAIEQATKYNNAVSLMNAGKYEQAIAAFESLNGYKDSATKISECKTALDQAAKQTKYSNAVSLMNAGKYKEARDAFKELGSYKDSAEKAEAAYTKYEVELLKTAKVGDYVFFGTYEQDNDLSNGKEDIEWLVLDIQDGRALVISKYVLDAQQYNEVVAAGTWGTWDTCTLRTWMNNDFLNTAFSTEEKAMIPTVTVAADASGSYYQGSATLDKIFALSKKEIIKYESLIKRLDIVATQYVKVTKPRSSKGCILLRTVSTGQEPLAVIRTEADRDSSDGRFSIQRFNADDLVGVCPAMWIDLN